MISALCFIAIPQVSSDVDKGVLLITQVARTNEFATTSDVDGLIARSERALREFQKLSPEVQTRCEMEFVRRCEEFYRSPGNHSEQFNEPYADVDRLEIMSVFAGHPCTIRSNASLAFLKGSSKGHLVVARRAPAHGLRFGRAWGKYVDSSPSAFSTARVHILGGDFLVGR